MATKKEATHVRWGFYGSAATLWADLSKEQIESVEGITQAIHDGKARWFLVVDPRYDRAEIYEEIKALAIEANQANESTD